MTFPLFHVNEFRASFWTHLPIQLCDFNDVRNYDDLHTYLLNCSPWARPTLLAICIIANPYRRIRPSNPEYFRLVGITCHRKRSHGCLPLASCF